MLIRAFHDLDREVVDRLLAEAFSGPQPGGSPAASPPIEVVLNAALLGSVEFIPELALVAELDGAVVGYCITTRGWIGDRPALGLGPIGVDPGVQRGGIGSALVRETLRLATVRGEWVVALLGDPAYYGRFGFVPSTDLGIVAPEPAWGAYFQAARLDPGETPVGTFRYAAPFEAF
ncbi:GNAT family N-acetyltransferase [Agromyces sp. NPDC057679]|uniref:GNAT family N-acetyltransferase n=1 Tax=Agromyces sp. NPDC057679 TaxID=3346207 RepID=UPI00366C62B4